MPILSAAILPGVAHFAHPQRFRRLPFVNQPGAHFFTMVLACAGIRRRGSAPDVTPSHRRRKRRTGLWPRDGDENAQSATARTAERARTGARFASGAPHQATPAHLAWALDG